MINCSVVPILKFIVCLERGPTNYAASLAGGGAAFPQSPYHPRGGFSYHCPMLAWYTLSCMFCLLPVGALSQTDRTVMSLICSCEALLTPSDHWFFMFSTPFPLCKKSLAEVNLTLHTNLLRLCLAPFQARLGLCNTWLSSPLLF